MLALIQSGWQRRCKLALHGVGAKLLDWEEKRRSAPGGFAFQGRDYQRNQLDARGCTELRFVF
jgi:hypothetical protein